MKGVLSLTVAYLWGVWKASWGYLGVSEVCPI